MFTFLKQHATPERILTVSVAALISSIIAFIVLLYFVPDPPLDSLGTYESPQIVSIQDPFTQMFVVDRDIRTEIPTVYDNDRIVIFGKRCVNRDSVTVLTYQTFTQVDLTKEISVKTVPAATRVRVEVSGGRDCNPTERIILIPEGVSPGIWRIDNIDLSTEDGVVKTWSTQNFEVIEAPVQ